MNSSPTYFFTADEHYGHTNIIKYCGRPFTRVDENLTWRIIYRIYSDAILILDVFEKKTNKNPKLIIDICKQRIRRYEADI